MISPLVYLSRSKVPFDQSQLEQLVAKTFPANRERNITGYLNFNAPWFFQYLEGEKPQVEATMERIRQDQRHEIVTEIWLDSREDRSFPDWEMHYISPDRMQEIGAEEILQSTLQLIAAVDQNDLLHETFKEQLERLVALIAEQRPLA